MLENPQTSDAYGWFQDKSSRWWCKSSPHLFDFAQNCCQGWFWALISIFGLSRSKGHWVTRYRSLKIWGQGQPPITFSLISPKLVKISSKNYTFFKRGWIKESGHIRFDLIRSNFRSLTLWPLFEVKVKHILPVSIFFKFAHKKHHSIAKLPEKFPVEAGPPSRSFRSACVTWHDLISPVNEQMCIT